MNLKKIDLSGLPEVENLNLEGFDLGILKLSELPKLVELSLNGNKNLNQVDLSKIDSLRILYLEMYLENHQLILQ